MISHEQDFGRWGNYRLAAMGEYERRNRRQALYVEVWDGAPFNSSPEHANNHVYRRHYATKNDWSTYYMSGFRDGGLITGVPHPADPSRTLSSTFVPFNSGGECTTALMGGHVDAGVMNPNEIVAQVESIELAGPYEPWMTTVGHGPIRQPVKLKFA